ncbi:hypothetical protein PMAYCL1PPCAC_25100, partial [Pristionchus mayeri]
DRLVSWMSNQSDVVRPECAEILDHPFFGTDLQQQRKRTAMKKMVLPYQAAGIGEYKLHQMEKAEMARLFKEREEALEAKAAEREEHFQKMIELAENKNNQLFALAKQTAYADAIATMQSELQRIAKFENELSNARAALNDSISVSCSTWREMLSEYSDRHSVNRATPDSLKQYHNKIMSQRASLKRNINELLKTVELNKIDNLFIKYDENITTNFDVEVRMHSKIKIVFFQKIYADDLHKLERDCMNLSSSIKTLPEIKIPAFDSFVNTHPIPSINCRAHLRHTTSESIDTSSKVKFTKVGSRWTGGDFFVPTSLIDAYRGPEYLGTGAYGSVFCFESLSGKMKDLAIKQFNEPFETAKRAQRCFRELQLLRDLKHENIVKMKFAYTTDATMEKLSSVYLTTEYAGLDLSVRLSRETQTKHTYNMRSFQSMISELLRALKYIRSANVIHRDLKPENLAISDSGKLTLIDFGVSRALGETNSMTQAAGTNYYRAIETISFDYNDKKAYTESADIWSLGAILSEMITGRILFKAESSVKDNPVVMALTLCGPIPENVICEEVNHEPSRRYLREKSRTAVRIDFLEHFLQRGRRWLHDEIVESGAHLADFINHTLLFDPKERMSVDEALAHPFLSPVRLPYKEVMVCHTLRDVGDLPVEEWKKLIWDYIQASPIRFD